MINRSLNASLDEIVQSMMTVRFDSIRTVCEMKDALIRFPILLVYLVNHESVDAYVLLSSADQSCFQREMLKNSFLLVCFQVENR